MVAEIFSQGPRSAAVSVSTMVNWFSNFTVGLVFPLLNELAIHQYSFLPFVALLIIFLNFIYRRVPETKGKTFEQISLLFRRPDMMVYESIIQQDSIYTPQTKVHNRNASPRFIKSLFHSSVCIQYQKKLFFQSKFLVRRKIKLLCNCCIGVQSRF